MSHNISAKEIRSISRTVPGSFDEKKFVDTDIDLLQLSEKKDDISVDSIVKQLAGLEEDFETISTRLKNTLPDISIPIGDFDEGSIQCITSLFGNITAVDKEMYFRLLELQIELANEFADEQLQKQELI